ncbi:MAG TPA: hypothetical protein VHA33_24435 [Candidatus Angelobacter sp.]|jgi:hypothetical protein|nr:hypothetical protein [Candidatus Angelobacter sp.]
MAVFNKTVISLWDLKDALIYFDNVIPIGGIVDACVQLKTPGDFWKDFCLVLGSYPEMLPPELRTTNFEDRLTGANLSMCRFLIEIAAVRRSKQESFTNSTTNELDPDLELVKQSPNALAVMQFVDDFNLSSVAVNASIDQITNDETEGSDVAITLASLKLINTKNTPWQQIIELRRDTEAREKLRRLRLFAYENYAGKPAAFIEDDILMRLADYEAAVKKWGFEAKTAAMTALLDSKLIAGGVAGSFLSAYLNSPLFAIASAAGAVGLAIGRIAVEIGRQKFALREIMAGNPVSYIAYAKEKL